MDDKYTELFEFVENVLTKQKEQKKRGLNDYNMVNVVRKAHEEVGMHSKIIYSLLDPNGLHYQGSLFLDLFMDNVFGEEKFSESYGKVLSVTREESTIDKRRIDFVIKAEEIYFGIEMKVNSPDSEYQISDYYESLKRKSGGVEVRMVYLTKFGTKPADISVKYRCSKRSDGVVKTINISFEKHILNWLYDCRAEVRNITNMNADLKNYIKIVKKITNKGEREIVNIESEMLKFENKNKLFQALMLDQEMERIKGTVLFNFFEEVRRHLDNQNYTEVYTDEKRKATEATCKQWFKKGANNSKNIGVFFDCKLRDDWFFHVEVADERLHFGIIKLEISDNKYTVINMEKNIPELKDIKIKHAHLKDLELKYTDRWVIYKWYSVDYENVMKPKESGILFNSMIDFNNSDFKIIVDNILTSVKNNADKQK